MELTITIRIEYNNTVYEETFDDFGRAEDFLKSAGEPYERVIAEDAYKALMDADTN